MSLLVSCRQAVEPIYCMQCVVSTLATFYVDGYNPIPPVAKAALTRTVVLAVNVTQLAALSNARITVSASQLQQQLAAKTGACCA